MQLNDRLNAYCSGDAGAATTDWTVVSAGLLLVGIAAVYALFGAGLYELTGAIGESFMDALFAERGLGGPVES